MKAGPITQRPSMALWTILLVFVALSVCYSFATRLKYGPDEPAHFIYVRSIATTLRPPPISHSVVANENSASSHEGHQPPLYYAAMALPFALLDALGVPSDAIWRVLRLLGILIGVAWIYFVYRLASEFFESESYALATAAFVALIPTASYMSGVISNDVLISLLFTWALWLILAYFKCGTMSSRSAALLGLVTGLAVLTKGQGLVLVPVLLTAAFCVCRRHGYTDYKDASRAVLVALGVTAAVSGWWFVRMWAIHGSAMPHSLYSPALPSGMLSLLVYPATGAELVAIETGSLLGYFWIPFWLVRPFLHWATYYYPMVALNLITLAGLVPRLRRKPQPDVRSLALLAFAAALTYAAVLRYLLVVDSHLALQGRLFLPIAAVTGIICVLGFDGWLRSARAKRIGFATGLTLMLLANVAVIRCALALYAG